jgi:very-short-patch-repair endonuclease
MNNELKKLIAQNDRDKWERLLSFQLQLLGLPLPVREFRFHPTRKWRFDLAYPDNRLAIEIEGATYSGGRHVRGKGYEEDCLKYDEAAIAGWAVLRVTGPMVEEGRATELIARALGFTKDEIEARRQKLQEER